MVAGSRSSCRSIAGCRPRGRRRLCGEVDVEAGMAGQPGVDQVCLVGGVVVGDEVDVGFVGDGLVDGDQDLAELDRAVSAVEGRRSPRRWRC